MRLTLAEAVRRARATGTARLYPFGEDPRIRDGAFFPDVAPRFALTPGRPVFTLGSCFARSLEQRMPHFPLPTRALGALPGERPGRPNGILNEYNPGTICQRLEHAASAQGFGSQCIAREGDGWIDLLLPDHVVPVPEERLLARRAEVDAVYAALVQCDAIILAFDVIEAWFDTDAGLYLNRMPPPAALFAERDRYELHILDADETRALFDRMMTALTVLGIGKVILTVSPVALEATYSGRDCVTANMFSKAVLLLCATELCQRLEHVDYFPVYEIVSSAGQTFYDVDSVHPRDDVLDLVADTLIAAYAGEQEPSRARAP